MEGKFKCCPIKDNITLPTLKGGCFIIKAASSGEVLPGEIKPIETGLTFEFPSTHFAYIHAFEWMNLKSIYVLAGVADSDYRGEYRIILLNKGKDVFRYSAGDEIARMHFVKIATPKLEFVDELDVSTRGVSGFGSTGL